MTTRVRGLTKVRNEAPLLQDTLDRWALLCTAGIHVFDDGSTDGTVDVARAHPAVVEVLSTTLYDPDRARADGFNRQSVLASALRFGADWIAYFDADEHWEGFDPDLLGGTTMNAWGPARWHDVYITPEDVDRSPYDRDWVSNTLRRIPLVFRRQPGLAFTYPDQRIMHHAGPVGLSGRVRHYGLGWSIAQWERKVSYYGREWPQYSQKWQQRRGQAVRADYCDVAGHPLTRYSELYGDPSQRPVHQAA